MEKSIEKILSLRPCYRLRSQVVLVTDLQQGVSVNEAHKAVKSESDMNELEGWGEEYNDRESELDEAKDNCKATLYPKMEKSHILVWPMLEPQGYRSVTCLCTKHYDYCFSAF